MYRYHPQRHPESDNYGNHAINVQLNDYQRTPGEDVCRSDFSSKFSILVKFRPQKRMRFTLLNITDSFSVVIDTIQNNITLDFVGCSTLTLPIGRSRLDNSWHRIAVAVDPDFVALYVDCVPVYTYQYDTRCRVKCNECFEVGVLEGATNVGRDAVSCHNIHTTFFCSRTHWTFHSFCTTQMWTLLQWQKLAQECSARLLTRRHAMM